MKNVMMTVSQLPKPIMMISLVTCQILTLFRDIYQLIQDLPSLTESSLKGSNILMHGGCKISIKNLLQL